LPASEVRADVAQLIRQRAEHWNDAAALRRLYTDDAVVLIQESPKSGLFRGAGVVSEFLSNRFVRAYRLTPVSVSISTSVAHVTGYYSRGEGLETKHIGYFQLGLVKASDGKWRIHSETPAFPTEPAQESVLADELIASLDVAGVRRAVVLSTAAAPGGRWLDIYRKQRTAASRRELVEAENDWTVQQARRHPSRLVSFCSFNPLEPYALDELRRCKATGHRGLKLHFLESEVDISNPAHETKLRQLFREANSIGFPIVAHVANDEPEPEKAAANARILLERIVAVAPDVPIQIAHLWGGGAYSEGALAAFAEAVSAGHPSTRNLYFDMAEAPLIALQDNDRKHDILQSIAARIRQIGLDRVLFGSDVGGRGHLSPGEAWRQFRSEVPLTDDEFARIASNVAPYLLL
jgi:predicted TIM-barrel fold metal-dependent hydrolase